MCRRAVYVGQILIVPFVKLQSNQDQEKRERNEDKHNKLKRGRPSLKSTPTSNSPRSLSRTPGSDGKSGTRSVRSNASESPPLLNGVEGIND